MEKSKLKILKFKKVNRTRHLKLRPQSLGCECIPDTVPKEHYFRNPGNLNKNFYSNYNKFWKKSNT